MSTEEHLNKLEKRLNSLEQENSKLWDIIYRHTETLSHIAKNEEGIIKVIRQIKNILN